MICVYCNKKHDGNYGSGKFCSSSCHSGYARLKSDFSKKKAFCIECNCEIEVRYKSKLNNSKCKECREKERERRRLELCKSGICEYCNKEHNGTYGSGRFCSKECARGFVTKEKRQEINKKVSKKLKIRPYAYKCKFCNKKFLTKRKYKKYCSKECVSLYKKSEEYSQKMSKATKGKTGGYRKNGVRSKVGYYKGIFCQSTYELAWVIWRLDHNLSVERFKGYLENKEPKFKYYPDFIDGNKIIEIKGFYIEGVKQKTELAIKCGYKIDVLYRKDLNECFNWIYEKYNTKNIEVLYDDYKPKYKHICSNCNKIFYNDNKRVYKFCSVSCSTKFASKNRMRV